MRKDEHISKVLISEEDINQPSTSGEYGIDTKYLVGDNGAALFEEKEIRSS